MIRPKRVGRLLTEGKSVRAVADQLGISKSIIMKAKAMMDKTITGTCKLCGTVGEIKNSHIVPNFILKMLKDDRKNQYALLPSLLTAESPSEPVQQAMREYLLCETCEYKFSKWENRFSVDYKQVLSREVPFPTDYFKQDWLLRLALSFAWRAGQGFLLKAAGVIPDAELAIVRKTCDFWSQFLLDENLQYTGASQLGGRQNTRQFYLQMKVLFRKLRLYPTDWTHIWLDSATMQSARQATACSSGSKYHSW